jgi:hypothetical protein
VTAMGKRAQPMLFVLAIATARAIRAAG